jgi:hypothetical protein
MIFETLADARARVALPTRCSLTEKERIECAWRKTTRQATIQITALLLVRPYPNNGQREPTFRTKPPFRFGTNAKNLRLINLI